MIELEKTLTSSVDSNEAYKEAKAKKDTSDKTAETDEEVDLWTAGQQPELLEVLAEVLMSCTVRKIRNCKFSVI